MWSNQSEKTGSHRYAAVVNPEKTPNAAKMSSSVRRRHVDLFSTSLICQLDTRRICLPEHQVVEKVGNCIFHSTLCIGQICT